MRAVGAQWSMANDANHVGPETAKHPDHFLAEWREYRDYSVRGLAMALSVSHSKISRIETGDSELKPSFAKKIGRLFKVPFAALYTINPLGEGRQDAEMLDAINDIAPEDKAAALRMLRSLARANKPGQTG